MAEDPTLLPPPPDPIRRRYRIDVEGGSWWELEWLPSVGTYEAVHLVVDRHELEQVLAWHGVEPRDVTSIDQLRALVNVDIPDDVADALARDYANHPVENPGAASPLQMWIAERRERAVPHLDYGTRWIDPATPDRYQRVSWIPDTGELYATDGSTVRVLALVPERRQLERALLGWAAAGAAPEPSLAWVEHRLSERLAPGGPGDGSHPRIAGAADSTPAVPATPSRPMSEEGSRLGAWDAALRAKEERLAAWEASLAAAAPEPRWSLPAAPATEALRTLLGEPGFSTTDVEEFARGLGLDPTLTEHLVAGRVVDLDVQQIAQLCESLQCSPYDMWGPELARSILHAYGPENWPRRIEPLDDDRTLPTTDDAFLRRRLAARADELAVPIAAVASRWAEVSDDEPPCTKLELTCFRRVAVLAVSPDGTSVVRDPTAAPDPAVEYHFSFRQVAEPQTAAVAISPSDFATGPLPGFDTDPDLAVVAEGLRTEPRLSDTDLVRMIDPSTGAEQWLGWDTDAKSWQTWDDPRRYYPADPADVLSTSETEIDQLRLDALTSPSAFDELGCGCVVADRGPSLDL